MIFTVFFEDENESPHDCESYAEAIEYAEEKGKKYTVEATSGEVV